ncbi:MAG: response regulator, partial [Vicinamibacterales bacterium]
KPAVEGEKPAVEGEKPAVEAGKPPVEAGKAPVEAGKAPAEAGKAPAEPPTMLSHEGNVPASVLVVEDDPVVRSLASLALRDAGHRVIHAASAEEASGLTITEPIDLLLCDVLLPGRTGPELVAELRERGLQVPVLFMTGYAGDAAGFQALLRSGADRIEKPFTPHRLRAKVREVLAASARAAG